MSDLNNNQKKEWAQTLYISNNYTQKEIALKVDVSEKTLSHWVNDGNWDALRKSIMTTDQEQLKELRIQLGQIIAENKILLNDGDPATKPNIDAYLKLVKTIHELEHKTGVGDAVQVLIAFMNFVKTSDFALAQEISKWGDLYIKSLLKPAI